MLPTINAVWIGKELAPVNAACLASFVRAGHQTVLHAFDEIEDLPAGIEIFDASRLMAREEIRSYVFNRNVSPALASDIYRLRLLREGMGVYVDCDVYCLKPFPDEEYLFGWETDGSINSAVMKTPNDSELLRAMLKDAENPDFVPPWYRSRQRRKLRLRSFFKNAYTRSYLEWASLGPRLLTYHVKRLGLEYLAKDIDYFYPLDYSHRRLLNCPGLTLDDHVTHRTLGLHLWCSGMAAEDFQPGSTLEQITSRTDFRLSSIVQHTC